MQADAVTSPYARLLEALFLIPISHYFLWVLFVFLVFLHNVFEIHFFHDLMRGFRGDPVSLACNACSELYQSVAAKCKVLHGRYLPTPWLASPHLQTAFLSAFGNPPQVRYTRHLYHTPDGGTIALDWLMHGDVIQGPFHVNATCPEKDRTPIAIVIPGLTSDSASVYIKHLAIQMAKQGWNVVVSNHRGLGGIELTSDYFYNAGWTEDIRKVIDHIHRQYPEAPLYGVGTSIGANILVKYLGEEGPETPLTGAAAVCSPWDLLICDRFINRRLVQKVYDKALTVGLQCYAQLHQPTISRLADWEGIKRKARLLSACLCLIQGKAAPTASTSRSVRDFDHHATRVIGKFETVDTYYRRSTSANFVGTVSLPLLCISALDDPVCTSEAIPWDECRANENIILATTNHGGHLAFYEGISATSLWWVRAVGEFFGVLHHSPFVSKRKVAGCATSSNPLQSSIDQGPYVNVGEDGMMTAVNQVAPPDTVEHNPSVKHNFSDQRIHAKDDNKEMDMHVKRNLSEVVLPLKKSLDQLSRCSRKSIWLLAYIAVVTTWPLVGPALLLALKKRLRAVPTGLLKR